MIRIDAGTPEHLGLRLVVGGANLAVASANATQVELCLFDRTGTTEIERVALPERTGDVFHGFVPGLTEGTRYGLRVHGPWDPHNGHLFNPAKLLLDPYARALDRPCKFDLLQVGAGPDGRRDPRDSAVTVPKCIAVPPPTRAGGPPPKVPWPATVLYELHVRGYTRSHPAIPERERGTFAALAHPAAIEHLVRLGVTAVELLPIAAAIDEPHLARLGLPNYWGYSPVAQFAPDPRLAPTGWSELAQAIAALHAAGIEVILDIVLNHSGEGGVNGPTIALRGIDNALYYRHRRDSPAHYVDDTGCGNTLALDRPPVLRMAMDMLRQYAALGVDGYRFDLATTLGRRDDGFDRAAPLLQAMQQDPQLCDLKLIAEPWDIGPGGYQLGAFPAIWGEWNDRYRDTVRRFWRGDAGVTAQFATRFAGSGDVFQPAGKAPSRSVNFITAHDGFTLADLVSYERKHNEANGEDNRDGTDGNHSWNHGIEGPTTNVAIRAARRRDQRNLLATLLLSRGTPMLSMGDELGRTQRGNNNAYAQDNPLSWLDWASADASLTAFVSRVTALRRRLPALRWDRWLAGKPVDGSGIADVDWRAPDGGPVTAGFWSDTRFRTLIAVLYAPTRDAQAPGRVWIAFHAGSEPLRVRLPRPRLDRAWQREIDTAHDTATDAGVHKAESITIAPRSVVVLTEVPATATRASADGNRRS